MRLGFGFGLVALIASTIVNVLTVAAELGGLAIILQLLFDAEFSLFVVLAAIGLVIVVALLPFGGIERIFGYCGLMMLVSSPPRSTSNRIGVTSPMASSRRSAARGFTSTSSSASSPRR